MSVFDIFRSKGDGPRMKFGFRGENIFYSLSDKEIELEYTWINGPRVYTESIDRWRDSSPMTEDEKRKVFSDVVHFVKRKAKKAIIVINSDDPSKELWEQLCSLNQSVIHDIEYTSDEDQYQFDRSMWLGFIMAGKSINFDGVEVRSEEELDEVMRKRRRSRTR